MEHCPCSWLSETAIIVLSAVVGEPTTTLSSTRTSISLCPSVVKPTNDKRGRNPTNHHQNKTCTRTKATPCLVLEVRQYPLSIVFPFFHIQIVVSRLSSLEEPYLQACSRVALWQWCQGSLRSRFLVIATPLASPHSVLRMRASQQRIKVRLTRLIAPALLCVPSIMRHTKSYVPTKKLVANQHNIGTRMSTRRKSDERPQELERVRMKDNTLQDNLTGCSVTFKQEVA